jgi:hypothetical protein
MTLPATQARIKVTINSVTIPEDRQGAGCVLLEKFVRGMGPCHPVNSQVLTPVVRKVIAPKPATVSGLFIV